MTEDASPENLRKFLESDDPAMIGMGLSMAKGSGDASREVLGMILGLYMFHDDKNIRALSKTAFTKLAPSDSKEIVRKYWQAEYRNQSWVWENGWMGNMVLEINEAGINPVYILAGALGTKDHVIQAQVIKILEKIESLDESTTVVMDALVRMISANTSGRNYWKSDFTNEIAAIGIIERIGGEQALEALIEMLDKDYRLIGTVANALGVLGDVGAVEPLIGQLSDNRKAEAIAKALGILGDVRAVDPLIGAIEVIFSNSGYHNRNNCTEFAKALGKLGDIRAIEPLVKGLDLQNRSGEERNSITDSISLLLEGLEINVKEIKNLNRFLTGQDPGMRTMGLSMLKGILKDA